MRKRRHQVLIPNKYRVMQGPILVGPDVRRVWFVSFPRTGITTWTDTWAEAMAFVQHDIQTQHEPQKGGTDADDRHAHRT